MRACVLTQKSEEAPASSASLLATPMELRENNRLKFSRKFFSRTFSLQFRMCHKPGKLYVMNFSIVLSCKDIVLMKLLNQGSMLPA